MLLAERRRRPREQQRPRRRCASRGAAMVRDLARTSAGVAFEDCGAQELKGIPGPQRLFAGREHEHGRS